MSTARVASHTSGVTTRATAKGRFAVSTVNLPGRVLHLVTGAYAIWGRSWPSGTLTFERISVATTCGRRLRSVSVHVSPPDFPLCNFCLMAELGISVSHAARPPAVAE